MLKSTLILLLSTLFTLSLAEEVWYPLFNGNNLEGWTIKVARHPIGENYKNTFHVENGILKVDYSQYETFNMQVAHLYSNSPYSHYKLRLDYKFVAGYREDAPFWVRMNSGVMLHSQSPLSMQQDQAFPVSVEAQFLATGTEAGSQTSNAATPGTHIEIDGELVTDHIIDSNSQLFPLDEWVHFEAIVRGNEEMIYLINGEETLRFQNPQLDPEDTDAQRLLDAGATSSLSFGHIALQAEGQNVWFRNIEIQPLTP